MCLANIALELSGKPYLAVHEIVVDLQECIDNRRSKVFGAFKMRLMKSAPSSEVNALFDHEVASRSKGARIIGSGSVPGAERLQSFLSLM